MHCSGHLSSPLQNPSSANRLSQRPLERQAFRTPVWRRTAIAPAANHHSVGRAITCGALIVPDHLALRLAALTVALFTAVTIAADTLPMALTKTDASMRLTTPGLVFELAPEGTGMGLLGIEGTSTQTQFVKRPDDVATARLWRVVVTDDRSKPEDLVTLLNSAPCREQEARLDDGALLLSWRGLDIGDEKEAMDVQLRVTLRADTGMTDWHIRVVNRSRSYGIWHVYAPVVDLGVIGESGADDYLIMPPAEGRSVRDPIHWDRNQQNERTMHDLTTDMKPVEIKNDQPATGFGFGAQEPYGTPYATARGQLQLCAYYEKKGHFYYPSLDRGAGLYLAAHDSHTYPKVFYATNHEKDQLLRFAVGSFPEDSARPGLNYEQKWPFVIGAFAGDWFDASMVYRDWALRQRWAIKGPLSRRRDVPEWAKRITAWIRADSGRKRGVRRMVDVVNAYRGRLEGTLAIQWYGWDVVAGKTRRSTCCKFPPIPFAQDGFAEAIRDLQSRDMVVYPYVNTRLWSVGFPDEKDFVDFEVAIPHVELSPTGQINQWAPGKHEGMYAKMCVITHFWREYLTDICRQVVYDFDVKGLYLDQAAEMSYGGGWYDSQGCHNPAHGHPLGITRALFQAEHRRMKDIYEQCRTIQPDLCICGEGNAEPFNDIFANKLIHYEIWPGHVPMWTAVYHDYITCFGRTASLKAKAPKDPIPQMQIGWQLVLGTQIGRLWPANFEDPLNQDGLDYLVRACALRNRYHKYLTLGRMLRPPYMSEVPDVTTAEFRRINHLCTLPAVVAASWKAPDGTVAVVLSNISREKIEFTFGFEPGDYGAAPDVSLVQTFPEPRDLPCARTAGGRVNCTMTLNGMAAVVVELQ